MIMMILVAIIVMIVIVVILVIGLRDHQGEALQLHRRRAPRGSMSLVLTIIAINNNSY